MKIIADKAIPFLSGRIDRGCEVSYLAANEITPEKVCDADALLIRTRTRCDKKLLEGSNVKFIATATIGTDHIDMPWCEKAGIVVRNAPGCNAPGVAQYVLASLLKAGFDAKNHVLGIVGNGNVGHALRHMAGELGISILINDTPKMEEGDREADYKSLDYLLRHSDAVSLHVPYTEGGNFPTRHLIGENELRKMKQGGILVNSSRGGVVDEEALKKALKERRIKAVTDVWENEPQIDPELAMLSDIATPHIAGYSAEGKKRATRMILEALKEELGINVDTRDLECVPKQIKLTQKLLEDSYDPLRDSVMLKSNVDSFERLRNGYAYRHEPIFLMI